MDKWLLEIERDRRLGDPVAADGELVELVAGKPRASSLEFARKLGRPHGVVLCDINNVGMSDDFRRLNFLASTYRTSTAN